MGESNLAGRKVICGPLAPFEEGSLDAARGAFSSCEPLYLGQSWRDSPEDGFRPGVARVGSQGGSILFLADLDDADIVAPRAEFNDAAFKAGDAFEIFLAPEGQHSYCEFHVTPGNARLQLRFPRPGAAREAPKYAGDPLAPFKIREPLFSSRVFLWGKGDGWSVLARVPLASILEGRRDPPPAIRFSLCRYDWTSGKGDPVLSSASEHRACDFHRVEEWMTMRIEA